MLANDGHIFRPNHVSELLATQLMGKSRGRLLNHVKQISIRNLDVSSHCSIHSNHLGSAFSLAIDKVEQRYLLSGGKSGTLSLHDLAQPIHIPDSVNGHATIEPLHTLAIQRNDFALVTSVDWFPMDNGMFLAASSKGKLLLFDANEMKAIITSSLDAPIMTCKFHESLFNALVAAGLGNGSVAIYDPRVGHSTSTINAHTAPINSLDWHPFREYQLMTASDDCTVRVWDIRKAGFATPVLAPDRFEKQTFRAAIKPGSLYDGLDPIYLDRSSIVGRGSGIGQTVFDQSRSGEAHSFAVKSCRYTPCGRYLITAGNDCKVRLWNGETGCLVNQSFEVGCRSRLPFTMDVISFRHNGRCNQDDILVLPITTATGENNLHPEGSIAIMGLHGEEAGKVIKYLKGHAKGPVSSVIVREARVLNLISAAPDGLIHIWERPYDRRSEESEVAKKAVESQSRPLTITNNGRIEARYDYDRDVLSRFRNNSHESNSQHQQQSSSSSSNTGEFVPPILRQYLAEAALAPAATTASSSSSSTRRAPIASSVPTRTATDNESRSAIDWSRVDQLLADGDDNDSDDEENIADNDMNADVIDASGRGRRLSNTTSLRADFTEFATSSSGIQRVTRALDEEYQPATAPPSSFNNTPEGNVADGNEQEEAATVPAAGSRKRKAPPLTAGQKRMQNLRKAVQHSRR